MLLAHKFTHFPYPMAPDGDPPAGGNPAPPANGGDLEKRLLDAFASIANKQGGADAAGVLLLQENKGYRDQIAQLKSDLAAAQGKVPGEGAVVLNGEQAADWQAYQQLGKPDELKTVQVNFTQLQRSQLFQQAAAAHGLKAAVLGQLPGIGDFQIEVKEQEKDGKKVKVAIAKNGDGQERPLPELINEKWADFKPALVDQPAAPSGTPWPKQKVGGEAPPANPVTATLSKRYAMPEGKN